MKKPKEPPNFTKLIEEIARGKDGLVKIMSREQAPTYKNRYIHWQKLKYLDPPDNLSKKEWWAALKFSRMGQKKDVPLKDINGNKFTFTLPDPALEYLHYIDQNLAGNIQMFEKDIANPKLRDKYIVHSLIEEAITSSQLEGATSTRKVAKEMLKSNRKPRDKSEQMILNNYKTMYLIRDRFDRPLSRELIFELHHLLTEKTLDDESATGRFRYSDENIKVYESLSNDILHSPPNAEELPGRVEMLCDFANMKTPSYFLHPVIRSIILHFWLAYDHPFVDGNGRCARALFYWMMLRQKYWLTEFISISQIIKEGPSKYGRAFLYTETDDNDLTYFILYHLNIIIRAIKALHKYILSRVKTIRQTEILLRKTSIELNRRQIDLISHSIRHPDGEYSIKTYKNLNGVAYETARSDLFDLVDKGLIKKQERGNTYYFYTIENLIEKLEK